MKIKIIIIAIALFLLGITAPKLLKMCQIRGWIAGANAEFEVITARKVQEVERGGLLQPVFWISWGETSIDVKGNHRINLEQAAWERIQLGDSIEVMTFPQTGETYLQNGIFASNGNLLFDLILFLIELGGASYFTFAAFQEYRRR
ncbi:MAG: hypothetical protein ACK5IJ_02460 [Mangrovibacterium sp.]